MDLALMITAGAVAVLVGVAVVLGVLFGKVELRPFRTSAITIGILLVTAMWLTFHYDITGNIPDAYSRGWVDASIIMVVFAGLVTSITKLTDDGGESDVIKAIKMFLDSSDKD